MTLVGLTGGIGSGKSTVAELFARLGIPIYTADDRAKLLMERDVDLIQGIKEAFGEDIYSDSKLNRQALAAMVFGDAGALSRLNALVHPAVGRDFRAWVDSLEPDVPYAMKEAAILFETGGHREMDFNILVTAPEELRVERVMNRDGVSEEQVRSRMVHQWPNEDKLPLADYVILNDGEHSLIEQVMALHRDISSSR